MAYRPTPNIVPAISTFYLWHGREMLLLTHDNLKLKISSQPLDHNQRMKTLKTLIKLA